MTESNEKRPNLEDVTLQDQIEQLRRTVEDLKVRCPDRAVVTQIATKVAGYVLEDLKVKQLEVTVNGRGTVKLEQQHRQFSSLLLRGLASVPVMLIGPAGSGKTSAVAAMAKVMGRIFYHQGVSGQTTKSDLLGYKDANGTYHPSPLYRAYTSGGVYLLDEIDSGNPGTLTILNAALSNSCMTFGDGEQHDRHDDFYPAAAANTFGTGASRQYVGRNPLDAATLDRFSRMEWRYDEDFERDLALAENPDAKEWVQFVQAVRRVVEEKHILHIVSPRASIYGARLLGIGVPRKEVEQEWIWTNLPKIQVDQIKEVLHAASV